MAYNQDSDPTFGQDPKLKTVTSGDPNSNYGAALLNQKSPFDTPAGVSTPQAGVGGGSGNVGVAAPVGQVTGTTPATPGSSAAPGAGAAPGMGGPVTATGMVTSSQQPAGTGDQTKDASNNFGITLDPSKANDQNYWRQIMQQTAAASGNAYDPSAESYWFPKIQAAGGMNGYMLNALLAQAPGVKNQWTPGQGGAGGAGGGGGYTPGVGAPGMGTIFGAGGPYGNDAGNSLYQTLMNRAGQSLQVDPNDPIIKSQVDAFAANQERNNRNLESQQAERTGPGVSGEATARSLAEQSGQNTSTYQGQLMEREVAARRQEIAQALAEQGGMLSDEQRNQLQEELGQLQLGQGAYQFDQNMNYMQSPLYGGG